MDFKEATDRLMNAGVTTQEIAAELGLAPQTVRAMRLDPSASAHRRAPDGWQKALAPVARRKGDELGAELGALADELEREP